MGSFADGVMCPRGGTAGTARTVRLPALLGVILLALAGGSAGAQASQLPAGPRQFIDRAVVRAMKSERLPGVIVDVSGPLGSYERAYGIADTASRAPMRVGTRVRIASVTESFTATAILEQVQRARLSLSDKLSRWIKGIPNGGRITVAQLLGMRSGLYDFTRDRGFIRRFNTNRLKTFTPGDVVPILRRHRPLFAPGSRTRYSTSNFILLGLILQKVTHRAAGSIITRDVIGRAAPHNTSFPSRALPPRGYARGYTVSAGGHGRLRDLTGLNPNVPWTAGAIVSTAGDLLKWGQVLESGTLLSGQLRARQSSTLTNGSGVGYGLGILNIGDWTGAAGTGFGFSAATFYERSTGAQIAIVANLSSSSVSPALAIFSVIAPRLVPAPGSSTPQPQPVSPTAPAPAPPAAPANETAPLLTGTARPGHTLSASPGTWTGAAPIFFGYQWQRCASGGGACQNIAGATGSAYPVTAGDVGSAFRVVVTASNGAGSADAGSAVAPVDPVVVAVGDIACPPGSATTSTNCQQQQTATLATSQQPDDVLLMGDNQYNSGLLSEYHGAGAYGATWGVFNSIVHPVPGNHEYAASASASGYFGYFGSAAGPPSGDYSYNLGRWHIVALNSDCSDSGCGNSIAGSTTTAQVSWLQTDLAANPSGCVLAYWHHPLFSSGLTLGSPGVGPLWNALYSAHADVVLNGHDHLYERYAQQDPAGNATPDGIREFVVGTGGESLFKFSGNGAAPQTYDDTDFGVLVMTLHASSYDWAFKRTDGTTVDTGTTACHGTGNATASAARARRDVSAARVAGGRQPGLVFGVRPLRSSLTAVARRGLRVAVHCSRGCDVDIGAWLSGRGRRQHIASFRETETQLPKSDSTITLPLPVRALAGAGDVSLILRFAAQDAAGHHRVVVRTVRLVRH